VPADCTAQNVNWSAFLNGRPDRPFRSLQAHQLAIVLGVRGGNCAENMVHQIAWIMGALDLPLPAPLHVGRRVF
jgi:hypothetical protein